MAESEWAISRDKVAKIDRVPMMHSLIFLLTMLDNRASKEGPPLTAARSSLLSLGVCANSVRWAHLS